MLGIERPLQSHERLSENGKIEGNERSSPPNTFLCSTDAEMNRSILILQDMGTWKENYLGVHFSNPNEYFSNVFTETQKSWVWERRVLFQPEEIKINYPPQVKGSHLPDLEDFYAGNFHCLQRRWLILCLQNSLWNSCSQLWYRCVDRSFTNDLFLITVDSKIN